MKELIDKINSCYICGNSNEKIELKSGNYSYIMICEPIENNDILSEYIEQIKLLYKSLGIDVSKIYFTSICKCFNGGVKNIDNCITNLRSEIIAIQPQMIILLGESVISRLLNINDSIENIHGKIILNKNTKYLLTYSLNEVINNEKVKIEFWKDIKENING